MVHNCDKLQLLRGPETWRALTTIRLWKEWEAGAAAALSSWALIPSVDR
jgi:hypothetical protein